MRSYRPKQKKRDAKCPNVYITIYERGHPAIRVPGNRLLGEGGLQPAVVAVVAREAVAQACFVVARATIGTVHLTSVALSALLWRGGIREREEGSSRLGPIVHSAL